MTITQEALDAAVGAKIDVPIDGDSIPSREQITRWAIDGAQQMAALIPSGKADTLLLEHVVTSSGEQIPAFVKFHKVKFGATNLIADPVDFNTSTDTWSDHNEAAPLVQDGVTDAPDGNDAQIWVTTADSDWQGMKTVNYTVGEGEQVAFSINVKNTNGSDRTTFHAVTDGGTTIAACSIYWTGEVLGTFGIYGDPQYGYSGECIDRGNGWYRIVGFFTGHEAPSEEFFIRIFPSVPIDSGDVIAADEGTALYGAHVEKNTASISSFDFNIPGIQVTEDLFDFHTGFLNFQFSDDRPGYALSGDRFFYHPAYKRDAKVWFVKNPSVLSHIPDRWIGAISAYAAAQARQQDDELNAYAALYQEFRQILATLAGAPAEQKG
jgi:hypothetical protein